MSVIFSMWSGTGFGAEMVTSQQLSSAQDAVGFLVVLLMEMAGPGFVESPHLIYTSIIFSLGIHKYNSCQAKSLWSLGHQFIQSIEKK